MLLSLIAALLVTDSLRTEVIFLTKDGMGAERALTLYDRIIGPSGESSAVVGRQPNMLVVRDTPPRLARFRALLKALDVPGAELRLFIRPMRYVAPSQLKPLIEELGTFDLARISLVADDRSGQLVVQARLEDYRRLDRLIRKLDVASETGRKIRVTPGPSEGGFPP
jgi:type II secretory pathway component GspD/PulD (secretin)